MPKKKRDKYDVTLFNFIGSVNIDIIDVQMLLQSNGNGTESLHIQKGKFLYFFSTHWRTFYNHNWLRILTSTLHIIFVIRSLRLICSNNVIPKNVFMLDDISKMIYQIIDTLSTYNWVGNWRDDGYNFTHGRYLCIPSKILSRVQLNDIAIKGYRIKRS